MLPRLLIACLLCWTLPDVARSDRDFVDALRLGHPLLKPVTRTSTLTQSVVTTIFTMATCARLVNVTGPCTHLGGGVRDVHEPVVLTFDEDMEEIDLLLAPTKILRYIAPCTVR